MNIFVIGNCQHVGIADCIRALVRDAQVKSVDISAVNVAPGHDDSSLLAEARAHDLVISQSVVGGHLGLIETSQLIQHIPEAQIIPQIAFDGFQPDSIYVNSKLGRLSGPINDYHSTIIAGAFVADIPEQKVSYLFNALTYARLDYFNRLAASMAFVFIKGRELGIDLTSQWAAWASGGPFMHTINHPHIRVLKTLAEIALSRAGVRCESVNECDLPDHLAKFARWPVYPEVARRLGFAPDQMLFTKINHETQQQMQLSLVDIIRISYKIYAEAPDFLDDIEAVQSAARLFRRGIGVF